MLKREQQASQLGQDGLEWIHLPQDRDQWLYKMLRIGGVVD
jgi:hypothetical protein